MKTSAILLTDVNGKPNAFGLGYIAWFYGLKGPTFAIYRNKGGDD